LGGRYSLEDYDTPYGVQLAGASSVNLDTTYSYSEDTTVSAYVTQQYRKRDVTDMARSLTQTASAASATAIAIPSGSTWNNYLRDADTTLGVTFKRAGLMAGKLLLVGDFTYSLGTSQYQTNLNYNTTTTGGLGCGDPSILSCGALPTVRNALLQFKLVGTYTVDKSAKVMVGLLHQRLRADDYKYNGLQYQFTPTAVMPTNESAGGYSVNVLSATYAYAFK
jgi:hypothetical protein